MKKLALNFTVASVLSFALSSCGFSNDELFPSLSGTDSQEQVAAHPTTPVNGKDMPALGESTFEPVNIQKGSSTGTLVGQKVASFRSELTQLQNSISNHNRELQSIRSTILGNAQSYHNMVGTMESKLQVGTTPGNPHMYEMLRTAQANVQTMNSSTIALNQLSTRVASDAAMTNYLLDSIRSSYSISGAVDEDHRQLRVLENEAGQSSILINSLLTEVNTDAYRQQQYVETANSTLFKLDGLIRQGNYTGIPTYGPSMAPMGGGYIQPAPYSPRPVVGSLQAPMSMGTAPTSGKPLFTAKFDKGIVNYQDGLRKAVSSAVAAKSDVAFNVVALTPSNGNTAAKDNAGKIFNEIINMGVSADRVSLSSKTAPTSTPEVQIFVQ